MSPVIYRPQVAALLRNASYNGEADALTNLIYRLKLEEAAGPTAFDSSVNDRDFTYDGAPTFQDPGPFIDDTGAVRLGGSPARVRRDYEAAINPASFTAAIWAKPTGGTGTERTVFGSHIGPASPDLKGWALQIDTTNIWKAAVGRGTFWEKVGSGAALPASLDVWRFLIFQEALSGAGSLTAGYYVGGRTAFRGNHGAAMIVNPSGPSYLAYNASLGNYSPQVVADAILIDSAGNANNGRLNNMLLHALGGPTVRAGKATSLVGSSITIDKPEGTQEGDLLLLCIANYSQTLVAPAGWTLVQSSTTTNMKMYVYYKYAGASEPANYTFNMSAAGGMINGQILAVQNVHPAAPVDVSAISTTNGQGLELLPNPVPAPTVGPTLEVKFLAAASSGTTSIGPVSSPEIDAKILETNVSVVGSNAACLASFFRGVDTGGAMPTQIAFSAPNRFYSAVVSLRLKSPTSA